MDMNKKEIVVLLLLIVATATRFLFIQFGQSAIPGFTAVGAMVILGATYLEGWKKWVLPLAIFWISDLMINNIVYAEYYDSIQVWGSLWVYGAYILIGAMAYMIMRTPSIGRLAVSCTACAVIFFLVTNFGSWMSPTAPYPSGFTGLMASYEAGIPFFRNGLLGDLFFGLTLFGLYDLIASRMDSMEPMLFRKSIA